MIILEGARNVGKTYLLDQFLKKHPNKFFTYKFPYFDLYQGLELDKELTAGNYFSYGKDLDLLTLVQQNLVSAKNLILDRGFVSSIVFAMIFRGTKEEALVKYIDLIKEKYSDVEIDIVYVAADEKGRTENNVATVREKDGLEVDTLNIAGSDLLASTYSFKYKWVLEQLSTFPNIKVHTITNHFDEESIHEFANLMNTLYKN